MKRFNNLYHEIFDIMASFPHIVDLSSIDSAGEQSELVRKSRRAAIEGRDGLASLMGGLLHLSYHLIE